MATRTIGRRVGDTKDDEETALGMSSAGDVPLVAVDYVLVATPLYRGSDVRRVRGGDVGLGHAECRARGSLEQRAQPLALLLRIGAVLQRDHVRHVWCLAVEHFGSPEQPAQDLGERGIFKIGQARAGLVGGQFWKAEIPEAGRARPLLQFAHERCRFAPSHHVFHPIAVARQDLRNEEALKTSKPLACAGRLVKIHSSSYF